VTHDEETGERDTYYRLLLKEWLVAAAWPRIEQELLVQVASISPRGRKCIFRLRPVADGVAVHAKCGRFRWMLRPAASDADNHRLPIAALEQLVKVLPAEAGNLRSRRPNAGPREGS